LRYFDPDTDLYYIFHICKLNEFLAITTVLDTDASHNTTQTAQITTLSYGVVVAFDNCIDALLRDTALNGDRSHLIVEEVDKTLVVFEPTLFGVDSKCDLHGKRVQALLNLQESVP